MEQCVESLASGAFRAARLTILLSFIATALLTAMLIGERLAFETTYRDAAATVREARSLAGTILLADERLTMSANMAAATGDPRWIARYDQSIPVIENAITAATALASREQAARFDRETRISNDRLVDLERRSFAAVSRHDLGRAQNILSSPAYADYKITLAAGTRMFLRRLIEDCERRVDQTKRRGEWTLSLLVLVGLAGFFLLWRTSSRRLSAAREWHRHAEARLHFMARNDELTQLGNRSSFETRLMALLQGRPAAEMIAVAMLDIDRFKDVNDLLGHPVGDALLRALAMRLQEKLPEGSILARFGGDEFAIAIPAVDELLANSYFALLNETCVAPFSIDGHHITSSISIGVAFWPSHASTPTELLRLADISLYEGKASGRNRTFLFDPTLEQRRLERKQTEEELRDALASNSLEVHYQPIFSAADNNVVGIEALLRWPHQTRGMIPPDEFIPIAEQTGLILALGGWVMRRVFEDSHHWPDLEVSVNVSPIQLRDPTFYSTVCGLISSTHANAHRICLEVTENSLIQNDLRTQSVLTGLRELGVRISIDDYGTGYSSLKYLMTYPFDKLKIDQSFVSLIGHSVQTGQIVKSMIDLGRTLGLIVVAEGVETEAQHDFLVAAGCHQLQGFLLGRPLPASKVQELLVADIGRSLRAA